MFKIRSRAFLEQLIKDKCSKEEQENFQSKIENILDQDQENV